jgi:hypothetical protein
MHNFKLYRVATAFRYETREHPAGPVQARGLNSFQLLNDGQRWCVLSATWDIDTAEHPLRIADGAWK